MKLIAHHTLHIQVSYTSDKKIIYYHKLELNLLTGHR
jgi:hypothetical protein